MNSLSLLKFIYYLLFIISEKINSFHNKTNINIFHIFIFIIKKNILFIFHSLIFFF